MYTKSPLLYITFCLQMYLVCTVPQETHLKGVYSVSLTRNGSIVHLITSIIYTILSTDVFGMYYAPGNTSTGCVQCLSDKEWVDCTLNHLSYI